MKTYNIAALAGDGIGNEVMRRSHQGLRATEKKFGFTLNITEAPVGWAGIDAAGKALAGRHARTLQKSDSILFGSVGLPDRDPTIPKEERPERAALLRLRKEFGLFANFAPRKIAKNSFARVPAREGTAGRRHDILVVRELTGGMYFGQRRRTEDLGAAIFARLTRWFIPRRKSSASRTWRSRPAQLRRKN